MSDDVNTPSTEIAVIPVSIKKMHLITDYVLRCFRESLGFSGELRDQTPEQIKARLAESKRRRELFTVEFIEAYISLCQTK